MQRQGIVPEDQWDAFLGALREDLPVVFRVAGVRRYVPYIKPGDRRLC